MNIFEKDLTPQEEKEMKKFIENFKSQVEVNIRESLESEFEILTNEKMQELDEAAEVYKSKISDEMTDKFLEALSEMKQQLKNEVLEEMYEENPDILVVNKIKELVYPLVTEDSSVYRNQLELLLKENKELKLSYGQKLGEAKLEELIEDYSPTTQKLLRTIIGKGTEEEVISKFYSVIDQLDLNEEGDLGDDDDDDDMGDDDMGDEGDDDMGDDDDDDDDDDMGDDDDDDMGDDDDDDMGDEGDDDDDDAETVPEETDIFGNSIISESVIGDEPIKKLDNEFSKQVSRFVNLKK